MYCTDVYTHGGRPWPWWPWWSGWTRLEKASGRGGTTGHLRGISIHCLAAIPVTPGLRRWYPNVGPTTRFLAAAEEVAQEVALALRTCWPLHAHIHEHCIHRRHAMRWLATHIQHCKPRTTLDLDDYDCEALFGDELSHLATDAD